MKTKAFYTLIQKRDEFEEYINSHKEIIDKTREEAKLLTKGSIERKHLMTKVQELGKDVEYQHTIDKYKLINFCINTVFYS